MVNKSESEAGSMSLTSVLLVAQVKGIPFLVFDAGGVLEMFSGKLHPQNVIREPTLEALTEKLTEVHTAAHLKILQNLNKTGSHAHARTD